VSSDSHLHGECYMWLDSIPRFEYTGRLRSPLGLLLGLAYSLKDDFAL